MSSSSAPAPAPAEGLRSDAESTLAQRLAGKYMAFKLGAEEYGIEILKVRELIGLMPVTRIPGAPSFIRGVINLRGRIIPVLELRLKFGMAQTEATDQTVIIVIEHRHRDVSFVMGVLVDEVIEVIALTPAQIEPAPNFGVQSETSAVTMALGKVDDRVICLLDIGRVLTNSEQDSLGDVLPAT